MLGNNYTPWRFSPEDFYKIKDGTDRLRFLIKFAVLAPSSHNSQPWKFKIDGQSSILIFPDLNRALTASDHGNRQLFVSLGAALENILVAARSYGYETVVDYFPDDFPFAVRVLFNHSGSFSSDDPASLQAMIDRHTNRNIYLDKELPKDFLNFAASFSNDALRAHVVDDVTTKNKIAAVVSSALVEAMDDKNFRQELSRYVKNNVTKSKLGMPMFGFGMPTPVSFFAPLLLKYFNVNRLSRKQDEELLSLHTPYFIIVLSRENDKESWIKSGQVFESIAIEATKREIAMAPMAAAIEIGGYNKKLSEILNTQWHPVVFSRIGYAERVSPHSPRLNSEEVIVSDE